MTTYILGIDPGLIGGIAFYTPDDPSRITAEDIPVAGGEVDIDTLARRIRQMAPDVAIIEKSGSMPKQGVASAFKFGLAAGMLRGMVVSLGIPLHMVAATKWKRHYSLTSDKDQARKLAIQYWPGADCFSRKKDHGRAEAALIAKYGVTLREPRSVTEGREAA